MYRSALAVRSFPRAAQNRSSHLSSKASFSSSSFSLSANPSNTPTPRQAASSSSTEVFSLPSTSAKDFNDTLVEHPCSTLPSVDANGDPTSFDEIAQLLRTILQKEDPTWEENRSIHLPYGRRFRAVMKGPSGTVLKGTELSDLIVRLAFVRALKARFGTLETIHFGMDPTSTTFPPVAGHECSFTVLNEPVGTMPTLNRTTGQKGFCLKGTLPAYFQSPPVGGPSFLDLIKLSAPVQPDFQLPNFLEPNEDEYEPYDNRLYDHEAIEHDQLTSAGPSSSNLTHNSSTSTVNDRAPLTTFTIEVYPDHNWSPTEILLPDQTFSIGYPEITRSSVAYLEKWERDLWIKGFRHFEGFTGGLRQARESAASRLNLDLEREAQAARYHDEQRRAGEIPIHMSVVQSDLEGDVVRKGTEEPNIQSRRRGRRLLSSDSTSRTPSPPQPIQPPPAVPPVVKTTLDRSLPPHFAQQAFSLSEATTSTPSSLSPPPAESSFPSSASKPNQDPSPISRSTNTPTEPSIASSLPTSDSYPRPSVDTSTPIPSAHAEGTLKAVFPDKASHSNTNSECASEPSGLFANLKGLLFGKNK